MFYLLESGSTLIIAFINSLETSFCFATAKEGLEYEKNVLHVMDCELLIQPSINDSY